MDQFVVNFDLFGGLSLDEWLEEDEKNQMTKNITICSYLKAHWRLIK